MKNKNSINIKGSIALISILIISAILLITVIGMSESNISQMYQYLNNSSNEMIYNIAEGCMEEAMIRIEENPSFAGTTLNLNDQVCTITVAGDSIKTVLIEVDYLNYTQIFEAQASVTVNGQANNVSLLNWHEI